MYRTVLRPRWLIGHVVVLVAVIVMVNLGFWQLRRLDERREFNRELESRTEAGPVGYDVIRSADPDAVSLRRANVRGTYDADAEVLVRFRSRAGVPGFYVLTPLVVSDGEAVIVNRGWVPLEMGEQWPEPEAAPPDGQTIVEGVVRAPESGPPRVGKQSGEVPTVGAIAVEDLGELVGYRLAPSYLVETGDDTTFPLSVPPEDLGEGPHLSYAVQWFAFSITALVVWSILVWRAVRRTV